MAAKLKSEYLYAGLIMILLIISSCRNSTISKDHEDVILKKPESITAINLVSHDDSLSLTLVNSEWILRGGDHANQTAVGNLLFALSHFSVCALMEDGDQIEGNGIRISCYAGEKLQLHYKMLFDQGRCWIRKKDENGLTGVSLPGFPDLDLENIFDPGSGYLLNRLLLNIKPTDIKKISVMPYRGQPFTLEQDTVGNISFFLEPGHDCIADSLLNDLNIRLLLSYFKGIISDGKSAESPGARMAMVSVENQDGVKHVLEIFSLPDGPDRSADLFRALVRFDGTEGLMQVRFFYLDVLMRGADHYLKCVEPDAGAAGNDIF